MNRSGIALPVIVVLAFLPVCARAQTASITGTGVPQAALQFDNLYFLGAANNTACLRTDSFTNVGSSINNALQMNITKRLSHGLFLQAAYTWGHAI